MRTAAVYLLANTDCGRILLFRLSTFTLVTGTLRCVKVDDSLLVLVLQ